MKQFNYKGTVIKLDYKDYQTSSSGRKFRHFSTKKDNDFWVYQFIFEDNNQIINFKFDKYNTFLYAFNND